MSLFVMGSKIFLESIFQPASESVIPKLVSRRMEHIGKRSWDDSDRLPKLSSHDIFLLIFFYSFIGSFVLIKSTSEPAN